MPQVPPTKAITDAVFKSLTSGGLNSASGATDLMGDMNSILADATANGMASPPEMTALIDKAAKMEVAARQIADAQLAGDTDAMMRLTAEFTVLLGAPDYRPEVYAPNIQVVFDAIDDGDTAALLAAL